MYLTPPGLWQGLRIRFSVWVRKGPADRDGAEALRRLLSGLARGEDVFGLAAAIEELYPRHNTLPGEVHAPAEP